MLTPNSSFHGGNYPGEPSSVTIDVGKNNGPRLLSFDSPKLYAYSYFADYNDLTKLQGLTGPTHIIGLAGTSFTGSVRAIGDPSMRVALWFRPTKGSKLVLGHSHGIEYVYLENSIYMRCTRSHALGVSVRKSQYSRGLSNIRDGRLLLYLRKCPVLNDPGISDVVMNGLAELIRAIS